MIRITSGIGYPAPLGLDLGLAKGTPLARAASFEGDREDGTIPYRRARSRSRDLRVRRQPCTSRRPSRWN